jgi:acetyl esterase/lipase
MEPHGLYHRARLSWLGISRLAIKLFIIGEARPSMPLLQPWNHPLTCFAVPPALFFNLAIAIPQCILRSLPLLPFIYCNLLRTLMDTLTPTELQFIVPPTGTIYRLWLAAVGSRTILTGPTHDDSSSSSSKATGLSHRGGLLMRPDIQPLSDGQSSILWLGDRTTATKFVLLLHGGGYVLPLDLGHLNWCRNVFLSAAVEGGDNNVAVAVLQYSLWPAASYPTQLSQAAEALSVILGGGRVSPSDVVFGGDSCGGHMAAGLLAHLVHPLPGVREIELPPSRVKGEGQGQRQGQRQRFAGVFLVSPWLSSVDDGPAFRENKYLDMVSAKVVRQSTALTKSSLEGGPAVRAALGWAMPGDVDDSTWWDGVDGVVGEVLVTAGECEVLREEVVRFAKRIRARNPGANVVLDVRPQAAHDFILLEGQLNRVGGATRQMRAWYEGILRRRS